MVDFQSRDTRRSVGEDDEPDESDEPEAEEQPADEEGGGEEAGSEVAEGAADPEPPAGMSYALVTVGPSDDGLDPADIAVTALDGAEASVVTRRSVAADLDPVQAAVDELVDRADVTAVVTLGGVGVGPDDTTPEAVEPLFDQRLDGFGELYRALAHERQGTAVVRARVTAGLVGAVPVFCLPGDPDAARHAVEQLVLPEAEAIVDEARGENIREDSGDEPLA